MVPLTWPCQYIVGDELCSKPRGHRWRHKAGPPPDAPREISQRHLDRIRRRFLFKPYRWYQLRPRCPRCRAVICGFSIGAPTGLILVADPGDAAATAEVISQYSIWFDPCGHEFLRITRPGDAR